MPAPRSTSSGANGRQPSLVDHLMQQAGPKPVNSFLGITKYYTSADLLLRQADSYRKERNEEQLFVMLMRFASLVLETLPQHGSYNAKDPKVVQLKRVLVERLFPELERLKVSLKARDPEGVLHAPQAHSRNRPADAVQLAASNLPALDWAQAGAPQVSSTSTGYALPPQQQQLSVDDLLDIVQHGPGPNTRQPNNNGSTTAFASQQQQQQMALLPPAPVYQSKYSASMSGDRKHQLFSSSTSSYSTPTSAASQYPPQGAGGGWDQQQGRNGSAVGSAYGSQGRAALIPRYPGLEAMQQLAIQSVNPPIAGPSLGLQEVGVITLTPQHVAALPDTCAHPGHQQQPPMQPQQQQQGLPAPPPQEGPQGQMQVQEKREVVRRAELRDVHVSVALMEEFLAYARSNTSRNVETCGILAGTLAADDSVFTITTLIVPKQEGTSDTVQALNEEEIYMVQAEAGLYPLGWIHTHPSQSCFLSSVDVHTHCGYQTMLDEAVAIVMAPTDRQRKCGIFRLSTPGGLQLVQRCNLRGFHAHPSTSTGQELYELCGHVYLSPRTQHKVIDLR